MTVSRVAEASVIGLTDDLASLRASIGPFARGSGNDFTADFSNGLAPGNLAPSSNTGENGALTSVFGGPPSYDHFLTEAANRVQWVTTPRRRGAGSLRIEVRQNDVNHDGLSERTEITGTDSSTLQHAGDERWVGMSFMFDSQSPISLVNGSTDWAMIHQFYAQQLTPSVVSGGSPPFDIEISNSGNFLVVVRGGAKATAFDAAPRTAAGFIGQWSAGEWHDFLLHVKWSTGSDGLWEVWHRKAGQAWTDTPQWTDTGVNVLTVGGTILPMYMETGLYRATRPQTQVGYYAGMLIRDSRQQIEAFWADNVVDESPRMKIINAAGLTNLQIDQLFAQTPKDGEVVWDSTSGSPLIRNAGTWVGPGVSASSAHAFTLGTAGTLSGTMTNCANFLPIAPYNLTLQRMKVTRQTATSNPVTIQLRRSTDGGSNYTDVTGFVATINATDYMAVVDPANVDVNEGDLFNLTVTTGSGSNLLCEVVGASR